MIKNPSNEHPLVLVIEDEAQFRRLLRVTLEANNYRVVEAEQGRAGLIEAAQSRPDLIVLDLGLPDVDGSTVLKKIREWSMVPVIILSARDQEDEKIAAFDSGADDYITKPFSARELIVRLRAAQRRSHSEEKGALFQSGHLSIDFASRIVTLDGREISLTVTEYSLLRLLATHAGKILTHGQILREVWGPNRTEDSQYLHVYAGRLREKIELNPGKPELLVTERGVGYRLMVLPPASGSSRPHVAAA